MAREVPSRQRLTTAVTRRAVVTTGVKLAYAAPVVAASLQLDALGARALDSSCTDPGLDPNLSWTFDPKFGPPGAPDTVPGFAACCGCPPDATFSYYPDFNYCCPAGSTPSTDPPLLCRDTSTGFLSGFVPPVCFPVTVTNPVSP
jgi:hypothetical protein